MTSSLEQIKWNADGLVAAIAQDYQTQEVLMMAWMNAESLKLSAELGHAVYWSRSRQKLWHKGESSGHQQVIHEIRLDCDADAILLQIEQVGGIACHTGRKSCFYRTLGQDGWQDNAPVIKDPSDIYQ
ncbi:MAG: phosphoribosyl-AMP cyclohydrolase [Pseudomonadales bacterium]|nr:phosphoribosyl-AMP cyclohydrolase [Pseudomonadales bacterium]